MKLIILSSILALVSAKPIIDLNEILADSRNTPIGLPEDGDRLFCRSWILTGPDVEIFSNGNVRPLYTNTEYGFSSLWSQVPAKNPMVSLPPQWNFTIDEFINMMSWNPVNSDGEITTSFIHLSFQWKFSNCASYEYIVNRIKSKMISKLSPNTYIPSQKHLVNPIDTTGCLDDLTCVKKLCFPVNPKNVYDYDKSQIILYNANTRICYKYTGSDTNNNTAVDNEWYTITDAGTWD